ncbi:uncharacterized protein LOC117642284 [Thrips palmi]|uniref:Uncharacterized protein LOC117642284 n=1 Tax=Thrips palmi TaxID=161013 RepID=A0A6P8Y976_THRPL|nr:uncharacterized protein LOC117642284 [Thrips palmi]
MALHATALCTPASPSAARAMLAVALLLFLAAQPPSAASAPHDAPALSHVTSKHAASHSTLPADAEHVSEPVVVFGSGRRLAASAHRHILDVLHGRGPVTVRLASGKERTFASGKAYMAEARSPELRGAQFIVPAETYPCDVVEDVVETELALRTHMLLPSGDHVPLAHYMEGLVQQEQQHHEHHGGSGDGGVRYPGSNPYQQQPLFHKQPAVYDWMTPFAEDVPEAELQVVLGGSQRLSLQVHDAVLHSVEAKGPIEVDLINGRTVTVPSYDDLLAKMVDPHFFGARVHLEDGVKVPVETYRAVVNAHKHKGVYVVDRDDHRMRYADYAGRRASKTAHSKEEASDKANDLRDSGHATNDE